MKKWNSIKNENSIIRHKKINTKYGLPLALIFAMGGLLFGYEWVILGGFKPFWERYFEIISSSTFQGLAMITVLFGCLIGSKLYRGRLTFDGRLTMQKILPYVSVQNVIDESTKIIELGKEASYLISPSHSIEGDTSLENIMAFLNVAQNQTN